MRYTGGFIAIIFRHSSNGENLAAIRAGEQTLQGGAYRAGNEGWSMEQGESRRQCGYP
jgi:hypothetical protein